MPIDASGNFVTLQEEMGERLNIYGKDISFKIFIFLSPIFLSAFMFQHLYRVCHWDVGAVLHARRSWWNIDSPTHCPYPRPFRAQMFGR